MIQKIFPLGPLQANCTLVADQERGEALIIDPGGEADQLARLLEDNKLVLKQILLTHGHIDHVGGAFALKALTGAPILMHPGDLEQLENLKEQARWIGSKPPEVTAPDTALADGMTVGLESCPAEVICTPGHTQGSVCFLFGTEKTLVAGDTLFDQSIGRTDLLGGNSEQIIASIKNRLLTLPDDIKVITGHGPGTTIGRERRGNPYVR